MVFAEEFQKAYEEKYNLFLKKLEYKKKIDELIKECTALQCTISKDIEKSSGANSLLVGSAIHRISITNIGSFPPLKYTEKFIYPLNYSSKRRYKIHKNFKKQAKDKVLYTCSIGLDGIKITCEDGYEWNGEELWQNFIADVEIETDFKTLEDFMGLSHPTVIKAIEKLGEISTLNGYIAYESQNK